MKYDENLFKELPVPEFLNEKILSAAADFAAHRRKRMRYRRISFGAAAAAAVFLATGSLFLLRTGEMPPAVAARPDVAEWSTLDQESFVLSAELNSCSPFEEEFVI